MNTLMIGFLLSVFVAMVLGLMGVYQWWSTSRSQAARRLNHRLEIALLNDAGHDKEASILKQRVLSESPEFARLLQRLPRIDLIDRFLLQSGLDWSVGRLISLSLAAGAITGGLVSLLHPLWLAHLAITLMGASLPGLFMLRCRARRLLKLEAQLPEAADLLSRALRAGHSLPSALDMAGNELPAPIGGELALVFNEINFGVPMNEALTSLTQRVPIEDLNYLVIAVLIQRESGGNLAEILDNVGSLIRKRLQLLDKVRVLSAEGRLGGWILTLLPPVVGVIIYELNPDLISTLWKDPTGLKMLWYAITMTCVGVIWIRQIVRIHI